MIQCVSCWGLFSIEIMTYIDTNERSTLAGCYCTDCVDRLRLRDWK